MAKVQITVRHKLGKDEALKRLQLAEKDFLRELGQRSTARVESIWRGSQGTFTMEDMGLTAKAKLMVFDDRVEVEADVPFLFRGRAETAIRERLQKALA